MIDQISEMQAQIRQLTARNMILTRELGTARQTIVDKELQICFLQERLDKIGSRAADAPGKIEDYYSRSKGHE